MEIVKAFLPLIIFLLIWFGIGIYYGKKVEKHKSCIKPDLARPENSLTLVRGVEQTNYLRKYIVIIDNEVAGSISSGETKHFEVGAGTHNIQVKIDWCKTKPLTFEITPGQNTYLCCGATYNDWRSLYKQAANPSGYIYIKN
jgi:hypothetical protein